MPCPACGGDLVAFPVPPALREHAPADDTDTGIAAAAVCVDCLRVHPASAVESAVAPDDPVAADFARVSEAFPAGEDGVAFALALGALDSLALNRAAIVELLERAEAHGADVFLALDRLAAEKPDAHVDLDRRRTQLEDLL